MSKVKMGKDDPLFKEAQIFAEKYYRRNYEKITPTCLQNNYGMGYPRAKKLCLAILESKSKS